MCIIFFSYEVSPRYRLILGSNRDELKNRPALNAHFWLDHSHILGGRDDVQKGTWLAFSKHGKFAALTNFWGPPADRKANGKETQNGESSNGKTDNANASLPSRGNLIPDFLLTHRQADHNMANNDIEETKHENDHPDNQEENRQQQPKKRIKLEQELEGEIYLKKLEKEGENFNGFSLILFDFKTSWAAYFNNIEKKRISLEKGVYGLSNNTLDSPWPKVLKGKNLFHNLHSLEPELTEEDLIQKIFEIMSDQEKKEGHLDEQKWNNVFVHSTVGDDHYGTRTQTVVLVDYEDNVTFVEKTLIDPLQFHLGWTTTKFKFKIEKEDH